MKKIVSYFFQGLIYIAPLAITIYILYKSFIFLDDTVKPYFINLFGFHIPGIGLVFVFCIVAFIGLIGQTIIARPIKAIANKLIQKAPLVKLIYTSIKDLLTAFVGKEKKFDKPVLVKVNHVSNLEKLGFLTQSDLSNIGVEGEKVAVYFPHSYNFSGEMFIVSAQDVRKIDISPSEVMKFIVSGGATNINIKPNNSNNKK
ncbi:MAG: DUF502 domain-containing protein [Bacteroidales bacterium]|jgi:uncharacterized membrane protein|nr:DUF502 domain-containing protein [Bacteroidales bacterium]